MPSTRRLLVLACLTLLLGSLASAQGTSPATGFPQWGTFNRDAVDTVNVGNLNVHFEFPIFDKKGVGLDFYAHLLDDNDAALQIVPGSNGGSSYFIPGSYWYVATPVSGHINYDSTSTFCPGTQINDVVYSNFVFTDSRNTPHALYPLNVSVDTQGCIYGTSNAGRSQDGWYITMTAAPSPNRLSASVTDPPGNVYSPTGVIDPNGNQITNTSGGTKDTGGYTVLTATPTYGGNPYGLQTMTYTYPGPTGNLSVVVNYTFFTIGTNFQCPSVGDFSGAGGFLPTSINMPDGTSYAITYESTNGTYPPTSITGRIHSLTLPSGAATTYTYSGINNGMQCATGSPAILTKQTPDGTWIYNRTMPPLNTLGTSTVKVTDPLGNDTVYTFDYDGSHELQRITYQGPASSNIVLQTTLTCYNGNFTGCNNKVGIGPVTQKDVYKYPGTSAVAPALSETLYNSTGQMTGDKEYDFGATIPPGSNFVRNTTISYGSYSSGICSAITGVIDHPCSTVTTNQSGTTVAQTNYTYNTANGNLTNVSKLAGSGYVNTSYSNNPNGTVRVATDARGAQTTYTYGACNGMYVTNISHPLSISESMNWDCNGGAVTSATDANSKTTTYSYTNPTTGVGDPFWRLTRANYPDGGQVTTTYNDTASPQNVATNQLIDSSGHSISTQTNFDALGRVAQTQLISDPDGATYTVKTYDALGRPYQAYNPTRCNPPTTNCDNANTIGGDTWGYATTLYDALGRVTQVTRQDGQIVKTLYSGNCATFTDEAGKARKSCSDGLGRLIQVFEDPTGLNYETDYSYDPLDNLLTVNQKGGSTNSAQWRTRTFAYDSLSRLTSASNPESGAATYTYDANGNLLSKTSPAPNQTGSTTVTLSYCYDALNRLTSKAYTAQSCPMSSPVATYLYDQSSYNGLTIANGIGRRTGMTDQAGSEAWSYDSMGRIANDQRTTNGVKLQTPYTYNLDGSLATITYPALQNPLTVTFQPGGAGRAVSESSIDATYALNVHYAPNGRLCFFQQGWGQTTTTNWTFNNRFQPTRIYMVSPNVNPPAPCTTPTVQANLPVDFSYTYADASGHNNGNVVSIINNRDTDATQNFTYDSLNRLATAQTSATNQPDFQGDTGYLLECWAEQYSYDPWGNLVSIAPSSSSSYTGCSQESGFNFTGAIGTNNRIITSGYIYDSAGNLIAAPPTGTNYTYDAESHLTATAGQTYFYDGDGKRVEKASGSPLVANKLYWYDQSGNAINETDKAGNELYAYYRFGGLLVAREEWNDWVDHYGLDALGNVRWLYSYNGAWDIIDYYPFGGERLSYSNSAGNNTRLFTGKERDSESGLDNFLARYNSSSLGRFMSPDPGNDSGFENQDDPQSWNAYSYVRNNPLNLTDPDGRDYKVCVDNGNGEPNCTTYANFNDFQKATNASNATLNGNDKSGQILVNGQSIGSYQFFVGPGVEGAGVPEDNILAPILFGGIFGGLKAGVRGIAEGLFGGGAKTAVEEAAVTTVTDAAAGAGGGSLTPGTVFNAGRGLLGGEAELSSHAAAQAAARGVTKAEIEDALSMVPKQEAGRGSVLRFIGKAAEVRVNRVTGTIVTVIRFAGPGAASPLP